ncbi:MAG: hypothetical protein M3Q50_13895 [Chloroflexota bacterium]|nr:hypothetical protein [Chloroflexia bacterium]MDQ3227709.1 hypothetical protein [Chloroflexota bacterium]
MQREVRLILTVAVMVAVFVALLALDFIATGGETALAVGTYGRHGSS